MIQFETKVKYFEKFHHQSFGSSFEALVYPYVKAKILASSLRPVLIVLLCQVLPLSQVKFKFKGRDIPTFASELNEAADRTD